MFRKALSFLGTKIGISLILALVIITGSFTLKKFDFFKGSPNNQEPLIAEKSATVQAFEKDTDSDGLKDWEEALYGFDLNNPDTKGNGLGDLKEIEKLKTESANSPLSESTGSSTPTATDKFSREIFIKYVEAKRAGRDITPELSQIIADEVLSQSYESEMKPFDASVLATVSTTDPVFIKSYGNSLGAIVSVPLPDETPSELFILEEITAREATTQVNREDLSKLQARYTKMRDAAVALRIPLAAKDAHAQLIQGIEIMMGVVAGIQNLETDPISSLPRISQYEDGVDLLSAGTLRLQQFFIKSGVSFTPRDAGYIFMQ